MSKLLNKLVEAYKENQTNTVCGAQLINGNPVAAYKMYEILTDKNSEK
jgi:hypothetical protein